MVNNRFFRIFRCFFLNSAEWIFRKSSIFIPPSKNYEFFIFSNKQDGKTRKFQNLVRLSFFCGTSKNFIFSKIIKFPRNDNFCKWSVFASSEISKIKIFPSFCAVFFFLGNRMAMRVEKNMLNRIITWNSSWNVQHAH